MALIGAGILKEIKMFVLRNYVQDPISGTVTVTCDKDAYVSFVYARTATDSIARGVDPVNYDVPTRKLFVYAFSLPFWAAMPTVCDDATFYDLLCFVNAQDIVVAPQSMFDAFQIHEKLQNFSKVTAEIDDNLGMH